MKVKISNFTIVSPTTIGYEYFTIKLNLNEYSFIDLAIQSIEQKQF